MISKRRLLDIMSLMSDDIASLSLAQKKANKEISTLRMKVFEYETEIESNTKMINGLTKKIMQMENKLCTCKSDAKLVKQKKAFDKKHSVAFKTKEAEKRLEKAIKEIKSANAKKQPRDKSGKFAKKK